MTCSSPRWQKFALATEARRPGPDCPGFQIILCSVSGLMVIPAPNSLREYGPEASGQGVTYGWFVIGP
jgi:hypothetical protein